MVAFLDANIFPHTWLTDVLLTFAVHHLFDLEYSDDVLEEARRAFADDLGKDSAWGDRYLSAIRNVKPYYLVSPIPELTGEVVLPDADDRHVAAAYNGDADVIVTFNLKDFPRTNSPRSDYPPVTPDAFLTGVAEAYPEREVKAMTELVASKKHPPRTMRGRTGTARTFRHAGIRPYDAQVDEWATRLIQDSTSMSHANTSFRHEWDCIVVHLPCCPWT